MRCTGISIFAPFLKFFIVPSWHGETKHVMSLLFSIKVQKYIIVNYLAQALAQQASSKDYCNNIPDQNGSLLTWPHLTFFDNAHQVVFLLVLRDFSVDLSRYSRFLSVLKLYDSTWGLKFVEI